MFDLINTLGLSNKLGVAEISGNANEIAVLFSWPQFFVALFAGVLMAFAFQLLLTNLSVAAGISDWVDVSDEDDEKSLGKQIRSIESKVGAWVVFTVNAALFVATFLAVKLSLVSSAGLGAILGVVIWSVYFLLLVWLGSNTVGSLVGSVVNAATSGVRGVMATAGTAMGANAVNREIVNTVEASVGAIRREIGTAIEPTNIRARVEDYFEELQLPGLNFKNIRSDFERLLRDVDLRDLANSGVLNNINRQTFVDLVSSRTDFSKQDAEKIVEQLESAWNQVVKQQPQTALAQAGNSLQVAEPEDIINRLGKQLDERLGGNREQVGGEQSQETQPGMMERAMQFGTTALVGAVLNKTNISDVNVGDVSNQVQQLGQQAQKVGSRIAENLPAFSGNPIQADVEEYLLNSQPWHLNRETIKQEFRDVIYDPEAAPGAIVGQLAQLNQDYFVQVLNRRAGDFTPERINEIAEQLQGILQEVSETVKAADTQDKSQDLRSRVEEYLRSTGKEELNPEGIERDFTALLQDPQAGFEVLQNRFSQFNRDTFVQLLSQRQDFSQEEADQLVSRLEETRDRILNNAQQTQEQAQSQVQELRQKVEEYLRNTNLQELDPEGIKQDFQKLFDDPQAGFNALRDRLSQFDRESLVQLLSQRGDLNEERINQIIDQISSVRDRILQTPQQFADQTKEQYEQVINKIAEYLRNTNLDELNPEGIQQDLTTLLHDPKEGAIALRDRLSHIDRETLTKLLSQREGISEEQVTQVIDRVQDGLNNIVKAPRRLAARTQERVKDFQTNLESYLRNTNLDELNPDSIKRDLQLLVKDPRGGLQNIGDRLSQFDRNTLVSLLSQREDISEEEANQIADRIDSVRNQLVEQIQNVQHRMQSAINGIFDRIRNYLNSLDRPELNYEGVKRDFRKLFDDPQAGFDAVKERLSEFDRDTLVAILSSRSDISEEDANRIISQVEGVRETVIKRAERLQQQAETRIKELKRQAKHQAEETRKFAAVAAWWLFGAAITSMFASALAGAIAVVGISGLFAVIH